MSGQIKKIIAGVCVVAVLVASMLLIRFLPSKKGGATTGAGSGTASGTASSTSSGISLTKNDENSVSYVQVTNSSGKYTIRKTGDKTFTIDTLSGAPLNNSYMEQLVNDLGTLSASQKVVENASDVSQYGLATPSATAVVGTTDNKSYTLRLGIESPQKDGYYLSKEGDSTVYLVDTQIGSDLTASAVSFVNTQMASVDSTQLTKLTKISFAGTARKKAFELDIDPSSLTASVSTSTDSPPTYNIVKPNSYNCDTTHIQTLVSALESLSAGSLVAIHPTDQQLSDTGLKNPQYTVSYTFDGKDTTLLFGNAYTDASNNSMVYAMVKGVNVIYGVDTSSAGFYNWELSDVAPSLLWTVNIDTVQSIDVAAGSKSWTFALDGTGDNLKVTAGGKTLDTANFRNYYQNILTFYNQGMADKPQNAALRLRITFNFRDASQKPKVLEFYTIDAYKAFYSINGSGDFYVKQSDVDNFIQITQDMADNKKVSAPQ